MAFGKYTYRFCMALLLACLSNGVAAQENLDSLFYIEPIDTFSIVIDDMDKPLEMIIEPTEEPLAEKKRQRRDWATWRPNPKKATWLALALPGAGQIYNRKYWKLPIVYGGFVGCAYAMRWNNMMYKDYSQAYLDIMDDDPQTHSYDDFVHLNNQITEDNIDRWKNIFKRRKDRYRRWRDMSFFVMVGVYALSVIDAYVDASLSEFDISPDLSMKLSPAIITTDQQRGNWRQSAIGMQCNLNF